MLWILLVYIIISSVEYILDALNIRHLKKNGAVIPPEFANAIDQTLLTRTRDYVVDKNRLGLVSATVGHLVTIVFIFGGVLDLFNTWVHSLQLPFVLSGIVFFMVLVYSQALLQLPFSWYAAFRLEAKYEFNHLTPKMWIADLIKSLLISTVLLGALIGTGLFLVQHFPDTWWVWVWGFFLGFTLLLQYVSPYLLEPLFNKFTPIANESLAEQIRGLMQKVNLRVSRVFQMDASKRSKHTNAYFTGIGQVKRIVLFDTLLEKMNDPEILAVLAHEIGHWKKKHLFQRLALSEGVGLGVILLAYHVLQSDTLLGFFHISTNTFFVKLILFGFVFSMLAFFVTPFSNAWSRVHEKEADAFAAKLIGTAEPMALALIKLSKDNLANLHPHPLYAWFHYSHPPVVERIRCLRAALPEKQTSSGE